MKTIKNQIGKMAVVIMVIFSMISCTKEEIKNPYPTPQSGSYNISENDSSGIANLMTEAEIVDDLIDEAPVDGVYKTGRIIAENYNARLEMVYMIDSVESVKLSIPLNNDNGYLNITGKGTLSKSDGTIITNPVIINTTDGRGRGHVTLMR